MDLETVMMMMETWRVCPLGYDVVAMIFRMIPCLQCTATILA